MNPNTYLVSCPADLKILDTHAKGEKITLYNTEDSAYYLDVSYIMALYELSLKLYPHLDISFMCNTGNKIDSAYKAINLGFKNIIFHGNNATKGKLLDIAKKINPKIKLV